MDLFFVISGFVIFSLTEHQVIGPRRFLLDRLARIAPLYWLATLLAFTAVSLGLPLYGCSSDPLLLLKSLLFIPAYSPNGHLWPTLLLGWTLNYEMFFYLLFAVFLCLPGPVQDSRPWRSPWLLIVLPWEHIFHVTGARSRPPTPTRCRWSS